MSEQPPTAEYLVICRGQWDKTLSPDEIRSATEKFYIWYDRLINEGKMKPGQRLTSEGKTVARKNVITLRECLVQVSDGAVALFRVP
jgi:hypothetical protein